MTTQKKVAKNDTADAQPGVSFEKALERLEAIVAEMEAGKTGLETMIGRFEEGQKLIALCTKRLNEVERRIEILTKKGAEPETVPFDTELPEDTADHADSDKPDTDDPDELF
ncbi:MAG: exodeoxyribonuclease VII small subunit [bacterium]